MWRTIDSSYNGSFVQRISCILGRTGGGQVRAYFASPPYAELALRDAMIGLAIDHAQAGAEVWTHIARRLRGQPRAEALTIAAICHCFLGDGIRAGIATNAALDEARASDTAPPPLAALLLTALSSGMPPAQISGAITKAIRRPGGRQ